MSEKFRRVVNAPHIAAKRLKEKIAKTRPQKKSGKVARGAGVGVTAMSQFLLWLSKYIALDNHVTRAGERGFSKINVGKNKDGKDKKFPKFIKTNPNFTSVVVWWMMLAGIGFGIGNNKDKTSDKTDDKIESVQEITDNDIEEENIFDVIKTYDANSASFKQCFMDENWPEIVAGLLEFETYRDAPKLQSKETRHTYGPGLTWVYKDGEQHACKGQYADTASKFSKEDIWNQVKQHCMYKTEVLSKIKKELVKNNFSVVTDQQVLGLLFAGYQTPKFLGDTKTKKETRKGIIHKLEEAGEDTQKIVDAFIAGPEIKKVWRDGTNKRRWWCAMYYIGKIGANDFLSMDCDVFSEVDLNRIMKDGHFVYDDDVIQYALSRTNKNATVQDVINLHFGPNGIQRSGVTDVNVSKQQRDTTNKKKTAFGYGVKKIKEKQNKDNLVVRYSKDEHSV